MSTPSVFTMSPALPFARTLAERLLARFGAGEALSRVLLLLPNRRACLTMREAFLAANGGKPLLLPRIEPLGEVDVELWMTAALFAGDEEGTALAAAVVPPAMPRARRVMLLAGLVHEFRRGEKNERIAATMEHAVLLAGSLADLLDEFSRECVPLERLRSVVTDAELSRHWEVSLEFLEILLTRWPEVERREGGISAAARQDALLSALAAHWRAFPPDFPVIAAGTTGSIPATAELLTVIARMPRGEVVLPGLDLALEEKAWEAVAATHPHYALKELLRRMGVERREVRAFHVSRVPDARENLLRAVMLPPEETGRWAAFPAENIAAGLRGISCVACETEEHEAAVIALRLRAALEAPERRAMLVTPDRDLACRVSRMLAYYGLAADDSSGRALMTLPAAVFLQLALECAVSDAAPVPLLALLRHPLCLLRRRPAAEMRMAAREIERVLLRGLRPPGGMAGLLKRAGEAERLSDSARCLLHELHAVLAPFTAMLRGREAAFSHMLEAHLRIAEALTEAGRLWEGHAGNALSAVIGEIAAHAPALGIIDPASYGGVLTNLLGEAKYQPPYGGHPRVRILSPMEARMQRAEVVILGGMNEGIWPGAAAADPWISRDMRRAMGLPPAEKSVGQSAHDIFLLAMAEETVFTRSKKQGNAPSVPSRWWLRMEAVVGAERMAATAGSWAAWGRELFSSPHRLTLNAPEVSPPRSARPALLSATQIETLMRDPYQFYAAQMLKLKPLDPLDSDLRMSDFGKAVHLALERYYAQYGDAPPPDALSELLAAGRIAFAMHFHHTQVSAFWWPRFERIAEWCVGEETRRRREGLRRVVPEKEAERTLEVEGTRYLVRARMDRFEIYADGSVLVADYKTGSPPALWEVERGVACQMLVEAWILAASYPADTLREPEYWKTGGGREAGKVMTLFRTTREQHADYIAQTECGLRLLLKYFHREDARYLVCPDRELAPPYNAYDHLERVAEWMM